MHPGGILMKALGFLLLDLEPTSLEIHLCRPSGPLQVSIDDKLVNCLRAP